MGRSDVMILCSVNEATEKIHMTSIMRDCYVSIPGRSNNRINAAYAFGGGNRPSENSDRQDFEKAKTLNLLELNELLNTVLPMVKTNMTQGEILSMMVKAVEYLQYDLESHRLPVYGSYQHMRVRGMAVLGIDFEENRKALKDFVLEEEE